MSAAGVRSSLAAPPALAVPSATGIDAEVVLAGAGARSIAFIIDWLIRLASSTAYLLLVAWAINGGINMNVRQEDETLWFLIAVLPASAIYFLYHIVLEPLMGGRTPGKRMIGLRVLTPEGHVPTAGALFTRNIFRIIDAMPVLYVVGLSFVMFGRRHLRLGDLAAGTVLAVERAPFLEKLHQSKTSDGVSRWMAARARAIALNRRRTSDVANALTTVNDYRHAARALGFARTAPSADSRSSEYLETVYADLHDVIHRPAQRTWRALLSLLRDRVPEAMFAMRMHLLAVTLLFITATVTGFWLIYRFPDLIQMFASAQLIATVERGELWTDGMLNVLPSAVLSAQILTNNIVVSFFAFCSGIVFGLGTFYLIGLNGLSLGAIFAFTGQHDLAGRLFDFVIAHGCVELSCICIAGAAGAYLGEALIRPGERSRGEAFRAAAGEGIRVLAVVTLLLFICGLIEGYVSPDPEIPRWARVTIGVGFWLFMVSLLRGHVFGRSRGGPPIRL
jgi:uncharacterized membrane protein SpoIIM required for sporulation/uncharacterized RDD family membrane protein YckC